MIFTEFFWRVRLITIYHSYILGWPKSLFGVFCTMLWKKPKWTFWLTQYFCEYFLPLCNLKLASSLVISDKRCQIGLKVFLKQWLFPDLFLPDSSSLEASSLKLFNGFLFSFEHYLLTFHHLHSYTHLPLPITVLIRSIVFIIVTVYRWVM